MISPPRKSLPWAEVLPLDHGPWAGDVRALAARLYPARAVEACAALCDELPCSLLQAVPQRQYEFLVGRWLARTLEAPCGRQGRAPLWPPGLTGSISHTRQLVVVAVAPMGPRRCAIGLDIERLDCDTTTRTSLARCFTHAERRLLCAVADGELLGFSAKEAVYKAVHAGLGLQPDFLDAEIIAVDSRWQRLVMNFGMGVDAELQVNFSQLDKHVLTACELDEALSPKLG